ncbi:hypothetical protein JCM6882_007161 [Rhodosporidiobolus microsporus]
MFRVPHLFAKEKRGNGLVFLSATTAGAGFLFFGYDQGLLGSLITLDRFLETFPDCRDPDISGITVAIYEVGCALGALCCILFGDRLGRKNCIALGMTLIIIGAVIMTASYSLGQLIVGRVITGLGNGFNTATVPVLLSELSPPNIRGMLNLIAGALVATGIAVAYSISLGFYFVDSSISWRIPLLGQVWFAIPVLILLLCVPESPTWLIKHANEHPEYLEEATITIGKIYDLPTDGEFVTSVVEATQITVAQVSNFRYRDLFTNGPTQHFRRFTIAILTQFTQQLTGVNLISYYATVLFEGVGLSPLNARIMAVGNGWAYSLCGFLFIRLVDTHGRRITMIGGTFVNGVCMVILTALVYRSDRGDTACGKAAIVFLFLYNAGFAYGWLGQGWLYPAEITPIAIRVPSAGASTITNWLINFTVVMTCPPAFDRIGAFTYLIYGCFCLLFIIPVLYLLFPETAGRSLEEVDLVFAEAHHDKSLGGYIKHSLTRPHISGKELDLALQRALAVGHGGDIEQAGKAGKFEKEEHLEETGSA